MDAREIAHGSALRLADLLQADGRFKYRYKAGSGEPLSGYNALRHAGAIWSILDVYQDTGDRLLLDCGRRAASYMLDSYLRFFRDYNNVCICEGNIIKLGGNGLAALALLSLYEHAGDRFLLVVAEKLVDFMLNQRNGSADLIHKRYFRSGKISAFRSAYYTGEALLAILFLYRITKDQQLLVAAKEIEDVLASRDYGVAEQSHWMLYFLELLSRYDASPVVQQHAAKIAGHILDHPDYLSWGRSTPIACRSEGLLALLRMLQTADEGAALRQRAMRQVEENLERQLSFRLDDGSFVRGGDDQRKEEVRIDYIQHNISSFLHYARIIKPV